ncbi:MAG: ester cyclase [Dehalococcoidia bacterium]
MSDSDATEKANLEVVSRFIEEFKNNANHGIVDEFMSPDFVHHLTDPRLPEGREGIKLLGQAIVAGFPDVHAAVLDLLADGDKVIERTQTSATHTGEFNGIPPTGRQVGWTEIHIYRLEDGKIVEQWSEIDLLGLLVQLGAFPGP